MTHTITLLATNKRVPVGVYVRGVKTAIANPDQSFKHGLETWWPVKGIEIRQEFRSALMARINRHVINYGKGRKHSGEWQNAARRVANNLNQQRIVTYERDCPKELKEKLAHRLSFPGEA